MDLPCDPTLPTARPLAVLGLCLLLAAAAASPPALPALAMPALRVVTVPILEDNYSYLLIDESSKSAAAVDPADANAVVAAARREGVTLTHVLTTHCHWDHAGGNKDMVSPARSQQARSSGARPAPTFASFLLLPVRLSACTLAGVVTLHGGR